MTFADEEVLHQAKRWVAGRIDVRSSGKRACVSCLFQLGLEWTFTGHASHRAMEVQEICVEFGVRRDGLKAK